MSEATAFVEVVGLSVDAGAQRLLENAALRVGAGELVLLVGGSGSGKSVLLRVMAGLVGPGSGVSVTGEVRRGGQGECLWARDGPRGAATRGGGL